MTGPNISHPTLIMALRLRLALERSSIITLSCPPTAPTVYTSKDSQKRSPRKVCWPSSARLGRSKSQNASPEFFFFSKEKPKIQQEMRRWPFKKQNPQHKLLKCSTNSYLRSPVSWLFKLQLPSKKIHLQKNCDVIMKHQRWTSANTTLVSEWGTRAVEIQTPVIFEITTTITRTANTNGRATTRKASQWFLTAILIFLLSFHHRQATITMIVDSHIITGQIGLWRTSAVANFLPAKQVLNDDIRLQRHWHDLFNEFDCLLGYTNSLPASCVHTTLAWLYQGCLCDGRCHIFLLDRYKFFHDKNYHIP